MNSILVFRSGGLGDFIIASPAFAEVRKNFSNYQVVLLTIQSADKKQRSKVEKYSGGTQRLPWIELVVPHLIDEAWPIESISSINHLWKLRRKFQEYNFSAAILMLDPCSPWLGRLKKMLLVYFLIGKVPIFGWREKGAFRKNFINASELRGKGLLKHHVHGPLQFLSEMIPQRKYSEEELIFDLRPSSEAINWAFSWLHEARLSGCSCLIAVAPGSIQPHKRWPFESFKLLLKLLLTRYVELRIIVIGTPQDKDLGDKLTAIDTERIFNLAGTCSITQSAALMRHCKLLVGNDGGAIHLGDAMGCKVVSIIPGIEFPDSIEPWRNKTLSVRHEIDCSPCYNFLLCPQKHNKCMTELPIESVFKNCTLVLDNL